MAANRINSPEQKKQAQQNKNKQPDVQADKKLTGPNRPSV